MTSNPVKASPQRLEYLDAIRGVAALAVLWSHYFFAFGPSRLKPLMTIPSALFLDGYAAVVMFFVLSGYVLSLGQTGHARFRDFRIGGFWIRRVCRIVPPFAAALLLSYLLCAWVYTVQADNQPALTHWGQRHWSDAKFHAPLAEYLRALVMVLPDTHFPLVPQAWTLRIEMGMSLLLPCMLLVVNRSSAWLVAFTAIAIVALDVYIYLSHFVLGILVARHQPELCAALNRRPLRQSCALLVGLVLYGNRFAPDWLLPALPKPLMVLITGLGAATLLVLVLANARAQAVLSLRPFRFLGRISYSLYLLHLAVILTFSQAFIRFLNTLGCTADASFWLGMLATTLATLPVAYLFNRAIEQPSIRLGKQLARAVEGKGGTSTFPNDTRSHPNDTAA
ncbi:acyltransferase family protein [Haliea sp. E17]|uniref:acyltransferase family protein n=1 Tax=Haliea sp. E17 TaxID=3401576 RepID=UPI003AADC354